MRHSVSILVYFAMLCADGSVEWFLYLVPSDAMRVVQMASRLRKGTVPLKKVAGQPGWPTVKEREVLAAVWQRKHYTNNHFPSPMERKHPTRCVMDGCMADRSEYGILLCPEHQRLRLGLDVKESKIHGVGLFAARDIPAYTCLDIYAAAGFMSDVAPAPSDDKNRDYLLEHNTVGTNYEPVYINAREKNTCLARCANAGKDGAHNAKFGDARIGLWLKDNDMARRALNFLGVASVDNYHPDVTIPVVLTTKDVRAGEEILLDYGAHYPIEEAPSH